MEHTANIRKEFLPKYAQNLEKQNFALYSSNILFMTCNLVSFI